ncbi:MAG: chemotaxis protein CheW [Planctomycetota bacterium]
MSDDLERQLERLGDRVAHGLARLESLERLVQELLLGSALGAGPGPAPGRRSRRSPAGGQVLAVLVDGRRLALPLRAVQEVVRMAELRPVPGGAPALAGALQLRGAAVPVLCLRRALGSAPLLDDVDCRIVILDLEGRRCGLLVDEVAGVDRLEASEVQPPPEHSSAPYLAGTCARDGVFTLLLEPVALVDALAGEAALELEAPRPIEEAG